MQDAFRDLRKGAAGGKNHALASGNRKKRGEKTIFLVFFPFIFESSHGRNTYTANTCAYSENRNFE